MIRKMLSQSLLERFGSMSDIEFVCGRREQDVKESLHKTEKTSSAEASYVGVDGFEPPTLCL